MVRLSLILLIFFSLVSPLVADDSDPAFQKWLAEFYQHEAAPAGISKNTFEQCFKGVAEPDSLVLKRASYQPEFTTPIWDYLQRRVTPYAVKKGQKLAKKYEKELKQIENRSGVSRNILLTIWSMKSNYRAILKNNNLLHSVPLALATLAYADPKRKKFAQSQLLAILQLVQEKKIDPNQLLGSWAGAMGHTQFIPTSYISYAIDFDGDGFTDLWNSVPDALATAANLLQKNGWLRGKTWGYEVTSGNWDGDEKSVRSLKQWQDDGFYRTGKRSYPRPQEGARLLQLAGSQNPSFLIIDNFKVIKRYNNSNFYALAVGLLADQIGGKSVPHRSWSLPPGQLNSVQKKELQKLLQKRGLYQGEIDGLLGSGSRHAIRLLQKEHGLQVTGMADENLLKMLKQ